MRTLVLFLFAFLSIVLSQASCKGRNLGGGTEPAHSEVRDGGAADGATDLGDRAKETHDEDADEPRPRRFLRKAHPSISFEEARSVLTTGNKNLRDGDLTRPCARMLYCYTFSNDNFGIGFGHPETKRELRVYDYYYDGFQRLFPTCLGYTSGGNGAEYMLRSRLQDGAKQPAYRESLGLVLSRSDEADKRKEARTFLEALALRREILRAEGYAALARLRYEAGEEKGALMALATCRTKTRRSGVCPETTELSTRQPKIQRPD